MNTTENCDIHQNNECDCIGQCKYNSNTTTEEQCFDFYKKSDKSDSLISKMIESGWELSDKWLKNGSEDFYKGMYAMVRLSTSIMMSDKTQEQKEDLFNAIGMDLLLIIENKKSKNNE